MDGMKDLVTGRGLAFRFYLVLLFAGPLFAAAASEPALPIEEARETALLQAAGRDFKIKRTRHFVIAYNVPTELVDSLISRLEATYFSICRFCEQEHIAARRPDHRLEVIFFNDRAGYGRYAAAIRFASQGTYGVYYEPSNRSAFFNIENEPQMRQIAANVLDARRNLDDLTRAMKDIRDRRTIIELQYSDGRRQQMTRREAEKKIDESRRELQELQGRQTAYVNRINRTVIQHETAHQVLYNTGVHVRGGPNPTWLVEGLACLFETPPGRSGAGLGAINQLRLQDFRDAVSGETAARKLTADDYLNAIAAGRIVLPRELITNPALLREPGSDRATHYAAAWALTMYLQRVRGQKLDDYLQAVSRRQPGEPVTAKEELALFERHFGPLDEPFLRRLGRYILNLPLSDGW